MLEFPFNDHLLSIGQDTWSRNTWLRKIPGHLVKKDHKPLSFKTLFMTDRIDTKIFLYFLCIGKSGLYDSLIIYPQLETKCKD